MSILSCQKCNLVWSPTAGETSMACPLCEARAALAESRAETAGLVEACEQERRNRFEAAKEWRAEVSRLTERLATISSRGANAVLVPADELAGLRERHEADLSRASEITRGALADRDAARLKLDEARGLLDRWFEIAHEYWHDRTTTRLIAESRAFLAATPPREASAPTVDTNQSGATI